MNKRKYLIITILFVIIFGVIFYPKEYALDRNILNCKSPRTSVAYEKSESGECLGIIKKVRKESTLDSLDCTLKIEGTECIGIKLNRKAQVAL
jgi:hypothetical protein